MDNSTHSLRVTPTLTGSGSQGVQQEQDGQKGGLFVQLLYSSPVQTCAKRDNKRKGGNQIFREDHQPRTQSLPGVR